MLGSVFAVAALGLGSVLIATLDDGKPSSNEAGGQQTATFSGQKLEKQVSDLLSTRQESGRGSVAPHNSVGVEGNNGIVSPKIDRTLSVPPCIQNGIGRTDEALAMKKGTYEGTRAMLVVLSDRSDSTKVDAYIVDSACVNHPSINKAKVLLTETYAKP